MNRKDIALTVAGVLATMALAYLFYRQQQQQTATVATAATSVQDVQDPNYYYGEDPNYAYQYTGTASNAIPTVSVPAYTADSSSSIQGSPTDTTGLLSQIIAAYHGDSSSPNYNNVDFSSLAIPTATVQPAVTVTNIPQTAAEATSNANNMLGVNGVTGGAVNPPSTAPVAVTTGQNLLAHFNHIVSTGN